MKLCKFMALSTQKNILMHNANIEIYQWLVPVICLFFISRTFFQFSRKKRGHLSLSIWTIFWLTIAILSIIPNSLSVRIAELLGFKSNVNAIIFVALGWLFILVFYLSATVERLELKLTELVRELALQESKDGGHD